MQNFVPRTRIGIFGNERMRSTPLDPKLKYWYVSYCLGAFWVCFVTSRNLMRNWLIWCNYCKISCHELTLEFLATNGRDPPHWTLNSSIGLFRTVWVHFGFVSLLHETRCKTA